MRLVLIFEVPMDASPASARPPAGAVDVAPASGVSMRPADHAIESCALLQGRRELLILHGDVTYRLRHTCNDKLILTK
jgi:hemin uptake protein HemP